MGSGASIPYSTSLVLGHCVDDDMIELLLDFTRATSLVKVAKSRMDDMMGAKRQLEMMEMELLTAGIQPTDAAFLKLHNN